jgi:hypothetical protein
MLLALLDAGHDVTVFEKNASGSSNKHQFRHDTPSASTTLGHTSPAPPRLESTLADSSSITRNSSMLSHATCTPL